MHKLLGLIAMLTTFAAAGAAPELTIERLFAAPDLNGPALRAPKFSPDGTLVTYLQAAADDKDRFDLWAYDIAARTSRQLVDSRQLVADEGELSPEEEARRERQRISSLKGIVEYSFADDGRALLFPLAGDLYYYPIAGKGAGKVRPLTNTPGFETDARFSPRGRYVSFIRDQNLVVYDLTSDREIAITSEGAGPVSYGMAEFIAQEEMDRDTGYWWSPDDRRIAYARVDETPVDVVERFEIYADETRVVEQRYPATGRPNARVELFVRSLDTGKAVQVDLGADADVYLARVDWFPDGEHLLVQRQTRDQKRLDLLKVRADDGASALLFSETSDSWVELNNDLTFLKSRPGFIWNSQRSGFPHLYLYDSDGELQHPLTAGDWMVIGGGKAVAGVDERDGLVFFTGTYDGYTERHLYSVPLDGSRPAEPRRITTERGWHGIDMSRDTRYFLDHFSSVDQPPQVSLRERDGRQVAWLLENRLDGAHPYAPYLATRPRIEFGTLEAADGTVLHWQLAKPRDFDASRKYPVIVNVYGGPHGQQVTNAWQGRGGRLQEYLVRKGFLFFSLDNRGAGRQGVRADASLLRQMGSVEVEDQIAGAQYLASLPFVDAERIGVFGWSYGGYMVLHLMFRAPDLFAAGVSGAPVTDWTLYDTHYTERYMGTPGANPEGYRASSVFPYAEGLAGPLLLMHGMADDNVLFSHSTQLMSLLQSSGKPFEVMVYPGHKHALLNHADVGPHAYRTISAFFERHLSER
ncbi:MAG TPA: S9 family peptidase [Steroidobacteraceae bacterium]|nr:S9 family peptidase [Steroidobacteraceae bacterium]